MRATTAAIVRLMARVVMTPGPLATECWISTFRADDDGYTRISLGGKKSPVLFSHRISYEHFIGAIPAGLEIDHVCFNRACVNPAHLEAVTHIENVRRGNSPSTMAARAGVCKRGHSLAETPGGPDGRRHCRSCRAEADLRRRAAS